VPFASEKYSTGYEGKQRGTKRQRGRRQKVDGPYQSQSSVPEIRGQTTKREHRRVPVQTAPVPNPFSAEPHYERTSLGAEVPSLFGLSQGQVQESVRLADELSARREARTNALQAKNGPSTLEVLEIASLGIPGLGLVGVGAKGARGAVALRGLLQGGSKAINASEKAVKAAKALSGGGRKAVARTPRPIRKGAKAVRRHPILAAAASPLAAEAPPGGDFGAALEGTGRLAAALGGAGQGAQQAVPGIAGNALRDLVSLPAQVLPSAYLTGKAGVKAVQGDSSEAQGLIDDFLQESAFPALFQGDFGEAASRAVEHPLYTALEGAGGIAAAGRAAGAVKRGGRAPEQRPSARVYGDITIPQGRYSKNAIAELLQRGKDRKLAERGYRATPKQAGKYLRGRYDRTLFASEQYRKGAVNDAQDAMIAIREIAGEKNADAVALAVQRIARNPETAMDDLAGYRDALVAQQATLQGGRLRANQATVERIERALAHEDPEALVAAANRFIDEQRPVQEGLHQRGLYDPEQTERASAIGFMRVHEDAGYGKPEGGATAQMLDHEGNPLSTEAIRRALERQGADTPGFISNRPGELGRGAYYRPSTERPSGLGPRATGRAVLEGTSDTSMDAIERQFIGGVSRLKQAENFDHVTAEYGLTRPDGSYFRNTEEAKRAIENPEDFDIANPDYPGGCTTRRAVPWPTRTPELDAQKENAPPAAADAPESTLSHEEGFMEDVIRRSQEDGGGPVVLFPKLLADRERQHFAEKLPIEKTAQAATGLFKGARLPTSPAWLAGNVADIWGIRTLISRVGPDDIRQGKKLEQIVAEELTPEQLTRAMESMVPGGVFGHVRRVQPHRAAEQFVGTSLEPLWRTMSTLRHAPGPEKIGDLYARYRNAVFHLEGRYIERTPQYGALAKHAREELGMSRRQFRRAVRDLDPALRDFARGLRNQDNIDRAAKSIESIYGNWGKNSPTARRFLTTWAPFWMWLRAATKFAFVTMPRDHPVLTSIIAAAETMTREERQQLGIDLWGEEPVPDFLQGGLPVGGDIWKAGNLTTFGMFNNYPDAVASMAAPNWASGFLAAMGIDWKGDQLVDPEGRPANQLETAKAAAILTGEAYIPFITTIKAVLDRGAEGALPTRGYDPGTVDYLRSLSESEQITVPTSDGGSSAGGIDYGNVFSGGGGGSSVDLGKVFGGG
jgi:hypothetical protein